MYTPDMERALAGQIDGPWIRYDLQRHANGSVGGYAYASTEGSGLVSGVVEYRDPEDMLDKVGFTRTESGCQITVLLDGESVQADLRLGTDHASSRTPTLSLGPG